MAVSEGQRSLAYCSLCVPRVEQDAETNDNVKSVLKFSLRENQSVKKFIYAFELWCWRRLLRVSWTARTSNQSILKEISPDFSPGRTDAEAETPVLWLPDAKN